MVTRLDDAVIQVKIDLSDGKRDLEEFSEELKQQDVDRKEKRKERESVGKRLLREEKERKTRATKFKKDLAIAGGITAAGVIGVQTLAPIVSSILTEILPSKLAEKVDEFVDKVAERIAEGRATISTAISAGGKAIELARAKTRLEGRPPSAEEALDLFFEEREILAKKEELRLVINQDTNKTIAEAVGGQVRKEITEAIRGVHK